MPKANRLDKHEQFITTNNMKLIVYILIRSYLKE